MKRITSLMLLMLCIALGANAQIKRTPKISILGDSYSTFEGYMATDTNAIWYFKPENPNVQKNNDVRKVEETWWYQVIQRVEGKLELNNSFSGSTVCFSGYKKDTCPRVPVAGLEEFADYSNRSFVNRTNKLGEPDIILICAATNDAWCGAPVGDYYYGNQTKEQLYTFRPAMAKMIADLQTNYPKARLLFILNTDLREEISESIHTILNHYNVPCLDLQDIDKQEGHPSVQGMKQIADQVVNYLTTNFRRYRLTSSVAKKE